MCKQAHTYEKYIKELDSLKVVVEQAVDNFNTVDSANCYEVYSKQTTYMSFIETHVKDTVSKTNAESLQLFSSIGKPIYNYLIMRPVWLTEARTEIKQLNLLTNDLKNGSIEPAETIDFISEEKKRSEKIIEELKVNTSLIRKHLEIYTTHIPAIETIVKNSNLGLLPAIIKSEIKRN